MYVLRVLKGFDREKLRSKYGVKKEIGDYDGVEIQHYQMQDVIRKLSMRNQSKIFIDETGIAFPIDLSLQTNLTDFEKFSEILKSNGLELIRKEKLLDVLVISDRQGIK